MRRSTLFLTLAVLTATGCENSAFLSRTRITDGPWHSFADTKSAYDRIVPGETTAAEAAALGFSPEDSNASTLVTYVEVQRLFVPHEGISLEAADPEVQRCVALRSECVVWKVDLRRRKKRRIGNFVLDWLYFDRNTRITGWSFGALILIAEDRVTYKIWSGAPRTLSHRRRIFPLGFIQRFFEGPPIVNDQPSKEET